MLVNSCFEVLNMASSRRNPLVPSTSRDLLDKIFSDVEEASLQRRSRRLRHEQVPLV